MSNSKHEGYLGPNDPAYYAPRERDGQRAAGHDAHPDRGMASAIDDGRTALATIRQATTPPGRNVLQGRRPGHAGGEGKRADRSALRAPRTVRAARRAPAIHPSLDRCGDCGEHRNASGHGHSGFATPRRPGDRVAFGRLAVGESLRAPGAAAGATAEAHGDPGRAGRQRPCQRSGAARNSRRRSTARRVRIHQRADGRRAADVRQAHRSQRVARTGDGDFRRFGHAA